MEQRTRRKKLTGFARLLAFAEDELVCDFAEVYGVFDHKALPLKTAAVLALGLRPESRAKMKYSGRKYTLDREIQMGIYDILSWLRWAKTKDGRRNRNQPLPYHKRLEETEKKQENKLRGFDDPDELMKTLYKR